MTAGAQPQAGPRHHWLVLARWLWIGLAAGYLAIWLASLPGFYARVSTLTVEPFRLGERVIFDNASAREEARQRGLSQPMSAAVDIASSLIQVTVFYAVAAVILWSASNGFGWFTALVLMLMPVISMETAVGVAPPFRGAVILIEIPTYVVWPLWILWLALFPNGRPAPRQTLVPFGIAMAAFLVLQMVSILAVAGVAPPQIDTIASELGPLVVVPVIGFVLVSQIYRYLRVSTLVERQQTKWFLFGIGIFFTGLVTFSLIPEFIRTSYLAQNVFTIIFLFFPVIVAIAILRYRLFEIDVIIRRALVYSTLTALLALAYFGGVVVLQSIFVSLTGQAQSQLVAVVSTLAIAALFFPLRRRVQAFIDRRFFRRKYDAARTLAEFAAAARDETDLEKLTARLVAVVDEAMQPEEVLLWLKDSEAGPQNRRSARE